MRATLLSFLYLFAVLGPVLAATKEQWRSRSIYQLFTDRFALPAGADTTSCDAGEQTWCGGTWVTITENLDYIQDMGFTAIWISPTSQNYDGPRSPYGDAYHGYWIADNRQLNPRFGTSDELKNLSSELHKRDMYLMVDIVANNVMAVGVDITDDLSTYMFSDPSEYHQFCEVDYSNNTSIQNCWLGDTNVSLPDINTQDPTVISQSQAWIADFVQEYEVDGLRIDAAKHVNGDFWTGFCDAAGVFCIGEVFGSDIGLCAQYQEVMDSVLNYPMYYALADAFSIPATQNMSYITDTLIQTQQAMKDVSVLGNFLENQDVSRWATMSVDPVTLNNALVFTFFSDGIPIMYYGQEQGLTGSADPYNRGPLWPSGYAKTEVYNLTGTLNYLRNYLVNNVSDWTTTLTQVLSTEPDGIAIQKGDVLSIMTNIGSPPANDSVKAYTAWPESFSTYDILTCTQYAIGSNGTVQVNYNKGGHPVVLVPNAVLEGAGLCGFSSSDATSSYSSTTSGAGKLSASLWTVVSVGVMLGLSTLMP